MSVTSTPRPVTPSAKAADSSGRARAHVVPDDDAILPPGDRDDLGERDAEGAGHVRRELFGNEPAHVVGLDEVSEYGHVDDLSRHESLSMRRCPRRRASTMPDPASALA